MNDSFSSLGSPSFSPEDEGMTRREAISRTIKAGAGLSLLSKLSCLGHAAPPEVGQTVRDENVEVITLTLTINGAPHTLAVEPRVTLLDALREYLDLMGTKKGCDHGQCGACTVLVNGERINSCLTLAVMHRGDEITTVEGLSDGDTLSPLQAAFIKHDAFQCGYCTPGQLCSATALLKEGHAKTDAEIREQMAGNLCRCGAYLNIVAAVREAMQAKA